MAAEKKTSPNVESRLRHNILKMPQEVYAASGIVINGRRLKSCRFQPLRGKPATDRAWGWRSLSHR